MHSLPFLAVCQALCVLHKLPKDILSQLLAPRPPARQANGIPSACTEPLAAAAFNDSQSAAIRAAVSARPFALIQVRDWAPALHLLVNTFCACLPTR